MRYLLPAAAVAASLIATSVCAAPKHASHARANTAPSAPATPVEQLLATARANYLRHQKDVYAEDLASDVKEGTPFRIEFRADDNHHTDSLLFYRDGKIDFTLVGNSPPRDIDHMGYDKYSIVKFGGTSRDGGHWVGSNAFGASRVVDVYNDSSNAIAMLDSSPHVDFEYVLNDVAGPAAKLMVENARVVIEGVLAPLPSGKLTDCRMFYAEATVDEPTEIKDLICYAGARMQRIALVNGLTGETIKEWKWTAEPEPAPAAPHLEGQSVTSEPEQPNSSDLSDLRPRAGILHESRP